MSNNSDSSDHEISVEANLSPTGGSAKVRSRFLAALDRLGANVVDAVGLPIEAMNATRRARIEAELALIDFSKQTYIKNLADDDLLQKQAIERHLDGIVRKQENIDGVTRVAVEELNAHFEASDIGVSSEEAGDSTIDELWMNDFEAFAEKASTNSMRELLGRILTGQVRRPNSFSRRALRVAYELDQSAAALFMKLASFRTNRFCPKFEGLLEYENYLELDAMGLISFNGGLTSVTLKDVDHSKVATHTGEELLLRVEFSVENAEASAQIIPLTQEGFELARLVQLNELDGFRKLGEALVGPIDRISIHRLANNNKKQYHIAPISVVRAK